jgi:hypothetical protein
MHPCSTADVAGVANQGRCGVDGKRRVAIVVKRALGRAFATGCPQDIHKMLRLELSRMARVVAIVRLTCHSPVTRAGENESTAITSRATYKPRELRHRATAGVCLRASSKSE